MLGCRGTLCALFLASSLVGAAAEEVAITSPKDELTLATSIVVEGTGDPDGATVKVKSGRFTAVAKVVAGRWSVPRVPLEIGLNTIEATIGEASAAAIAVRGNRIERRPTQFVRFIWSSEAESELKEIARKTLTTPLTEAQLGDFVANVKRRTVEVLERAYAGIADVKVVEKSVPNTHTISVLDLSPDGRDLFGSSRGDCGNADLSQVTRVFAGQYRKSMTKHFDRWGPMRKDDPPEVRIEDLGQALGRTSAHELGHSLGLVRELNTQTVGVCTWMNGCDGSHNCAAFDLDHPAANRFNDGWHIMDPGGTTLNNARLGEPSPNRRAASRTPAWFEPFSASYLRIIHPLEKRRVK
jgi:hypothetical protein